MEITEIILTAKRSGEPSSPILTMVRRTKCDKQGAEMEITEIILATVSRLCQLSNYSRGFLQGYGFLIACGGGIYDTTKQ